MNQISHWLDASNIYGSSESDAFELREAFGGQLKQSRVAGAQRGHLPSCSSARTTTVSMCSGCSKCFFAGKYSYKLVSRLSINWFIQY